MNLMTPEEARHVLEADALPPADPHRYWRALDTIAGMREEWGVSYRRVSYRRDHENEKRTTWGWETREDAERYMRLMTDVHVYGIVRRYVTEPEEA